MEFKGGFIMENERFMPDEMGEVFDIRIHVFEDENGKIQCNIMNGKNDNSFAHGTKNTKEEIGQYINKVITNLLDME